MSKNKATELSEFGEAALALDKDFLLIERISRELERLANPSDKGMERAQTLLQQAEAARTEMAAHMQAMAQTLEDARRRNGAAEAIIAERALVVQERQREGEKLVERFQLLAGMVRQITEANLQFQKLKANKMSNEDRVALSNHIPKINEQLAVLVEEANNLMIDSRKAHLKTLERNTDSLRQSLQALRVRLLGLFENPGIL